jgi:DNA-binding SARP family transcriptional activator/tetratricopeptide (TPR) repeat protein
MLTMRLLGDFAVEADGLPVALPPGRPTSLLAWLALSPGMHPRGELAACFWPGVLDASARASLRSALWTLRSALGDAAEHLGTARDRLGLIGDIRTDLAEFDRLARQGDLEAAVDLCRSPLLRGLDGDWVVDAREEHQRRLDRVLHELVARAEATRDWRGAVRWSRHRAALDPLSEESCRDLMRMLVASGDRAGALTVYARLCDRLARQLGMTPSAETRALARSFRGTGHEPDASDPPRPAAPRTIVAANAPPLTGRDDELAQVVAAWRHAARGRGGVVVITGEGGIGKTRLVEELLETVRGDGGSIAASATLDLGGGPPLALWAALLRDLARDRPPPSDAAWVADLALLSPELRSEDETSEPARPASPELQRTRLFESMVSMVEWAAREKPHVLVMEDVHAADPASLELAGYVARRLGGMRLLLVLTRRIAPRRPEVDALLHRLPARGGIAADVELGPLGTEDLTRMVRAVGDLDDEHVSRIVDTAEGNPLLALETARAAATGRTPVDGLRALVRVAMARIHGDARLVAELVAVAGRDIDRVEATRLPVSDFAAAAEGAAETDLLVAREGGLGYRHALLRDAVYTELSAPRRAWLHQTFAAALDSERSPGRAAEAARHLLLAGCDEAAVEHLARAAQHARSLGAYLEAAGFLEEALRMSPADTDLLQELAEAEAWCGRREQALAAFDRVRAALVAGDPAEQARAWIRRGRWLRGALCYPRESRAAYLHALELLDEAELPLPGERAEALAGLAWAEAVAGDADHAEELLATLDGLETADRRVRLDRDVARGHLLIRQGRFADAYATLAAAAESARELGRPDMAYSCLINASSAAACVLEFERSLEFADRCRAMMHEAALAPLEANTFAARAHILTRLGRLDDALASAVAEAMLAERLDDPRISAMAEHDRGVVCHAIGEHAEAERLLAAALENDAPVSRPVARLVRAESLVALGRLDEAELALRAVALEPVSEADFPDTLVARLARVQALIATARGDGAEAARRLEEAARTWRRRAGAFRLGDRYMAVMIDLGRPPVLGLVEPRRELERVEAELAALHATVPSSWEKEC